MGNCGQQRPYRKELSVEREVQTRACADETQRRLPSAPQRERIPSGGAERVQECVCGDGFSGEAAKGAEDNMTCGGCGGTPSGATTNVVRVWKRGVCVDSTSDIAKTFSLPPLAGEGLGMGGTCVSVQCSKNRRSRQMLN